MKRLRYSLLTLLSVYLLVACSSEEHPDNKPGGVNNPYPDVAIEAAANVAIDPADTEMEYFVPVTLSVSAPSAGAVRFRTLPGTAVANRDFISATGSVDFAEGERQVNIPVTLLNDAGRLNDRSFTVELTGATNATLSANVSQQITLTARGANDGEPGSVPLLSLPTTIDWTAPTSGTQNYSVVIPLSQRLTSAASVEIRAVPGSARLGEHFNAITGTNCVEGVCALTAGQTELSFFVPIMGGTSETERSFRLQFLSPEGLELPQNREVSVNLTYDTAPDSETPDLNVPQTLTLRMPESAARSPLSYPVVLTLSEALQSEASIEWRTVSDSAIAGTHFIAVDNTGANASTLSAGAREFAFELQLLHDPALTENVSFTLQLVSADGVALPSERSIEVEVVNTNPGAGTTPTVSVPTEVVYHEPTVDTVFTIRLPLSEAMSSAGDIRVTLLEETAKSGIDFTAFDSIVPIPSNSTEINIPVELLFNPETTSERTFRVELAAPLNVVLPNQRTFTVRIIDSGSAAPEPTMQLTPSVIRVPTPREPGPQQTVTLYFPFTDALPADATVTVRSLNGTAAAGIDFVEVAEVNRNLAQGTSELALALGLQVTGASEERSFDLRFTNPTGIRLPDSPSVTVQIDPLDTAELPTVSVPEEVQLVAPEAGLPDEAKRRTIVIPFDDFAPLAGRFVVRTQDRWAREGIEFALVKSNIAYSKGAREVVIEFDVEPVTSTLDFDLILETGTNVQLPDDEAERVIRVIIVPF